MDKIRYELKRKLLQIVAFGFTNSRITNFANGKIYTGSFKKFCSPGLNCYSCPAATFACPIGAMQAVSSSMNFSFGFYAFGFVLAIGVVFGRIICGYVCPFGLIQELINLIPIKNIKIPKWMTYIKYVILIVFVLILPITILNYMGMGKPTFCQYICPAGTLEGGVALLSTHSELREIIGSLFTLKLMILIIVIIACTFIYRFFCKTMCPLGAIYGLLNKISFCHMKYDSDKCIHCDKCIAVCPMDTNPTKDCNSPECIRCNRCVESCPTKALSTGFIKVKL